MEAGGEECCLTPLTLLILCTNGVMWWYRGRRGVSWSLALLLTGVMLSALVCPGCWVVLLVSVVCSLVHFSAGREEAVLPAQGRAVLITGCDSGFGHDLAKLLARAGMKVYAGVLDGSGPGAEMLRTVSSQLTVLQLDITDVNQTLEAHQLIKSQIGDTGLWGLVNNAGVLGFTCDGEILPTRMLRKVLQVNFISTVEVTRAFLPMIRQAKGRIVTLSSVAGEVPFPGFAAYGASKAALNLYFGAMRHEVARWGVKVALIQPGSFKTKILGSQEEWAKVQEEILRTLPVEVKATYGEEYISSMKDRLSNMTAHACTNLEPVLHDIKHALLSESPRLFYHPGPAAWALPFTQRFCPTWLFDAIFKKLVLNHG
ncbi:17-beta-hydroxysteroid dehydrogenase type 2 [Brachyhypopomus gauderio]|uniref:17-beta-hydroxysteroid dehydrogenase type 2 n=1 Tax=Brachyhypopomus gauderio TaxID=698409 RepID=UPI004042626B